MSQTRPVFHPITPPTGVSDEDLAQFASSQGVGTMVKPTSRTPVAIPQIAQDAPNEPSRTTPSAPGTRKASTARKTAPASATLPDLKLSVLVPRYVGKALRQRAVDNDCTERHLVLQGLQAIGIAIEEADLHPDRRSGSYRKNAR